VSIFQFSHLGRLREGAVAHRPGFLTGGDVGDADQIFQSLTSAAPPRPVHHLLPRGFFLYSAMFAAVGAISSSERSPTGAATDLLAARAVVREHVRHAERSASTLRSRCRSSRQLPDRDAGALGAGNLPTYEVALSLESSRVDCRGHVDRGRGYTAWNAHDGKAAESARTGSLGQGGVDG